MFVLRLQAPILRPVELTSVEVPPKSEPHDGPPQKVKSINDALCAMRRAADCCILLANQDTVIANTACLRATLLVDLFTRLLPIPLSISPEVRALWTDGSFAPPWSMWWQNGCSWDFLPAVFWGVLLGIAAG